MRQVVSLTTYSYGTHVSIAFITGAGDFLNLYTYLLAKNIVANPIKVVLFGNAGNIPDVLSNEVESLSEKLPCCDYYFLNTIEGVGGLLSIMDEIVNDACIVFETLFITHVFGAFEESILNVIHYDKLVLIENGIATYYPPKSRVINTDSDCYYSSTPSVKVDEAWLPLSPYIGIPFYLNESIVDSPDKNTYKKSTTELFGADHSDFIDNASNILYVAGTSLYRLGIISIEDELNCYFRFIEEASNMDYDYIIWKPHPRMASQYNMFSSISDCVKIVARPIPIEALYSVEKDCSVSCASIASSSLLTAQHYFGANSKLIPATMSLTDRIPHIHKILDLMNGRA